jgi:hypothetical protein
VPTLKILHIADIHLDLQYQVGAEGDCSKLQCCQAQDGPASDPDTAAGMFGSYEDCDIPDTLLDDAFTHILEQHPVSNNNNNNNNMIYDDDDDEILLILLLIVSRDELA